MKPLSKAELLLASRLLSLASDVFSNHGCNDMGQEMFDGIPPAELKVLADGVAIDEFGDGEEIHWNWIGDSVWMSFLAKRLKECA